MNEFNISWTSLWRILFMLFFGVALYFLRDVALILLLSLIISSALDAPITFLERKKIPRILGTFLIFIVIISALSLVLYTIIPVVILELKSLFNGLQKISLPAFGQLGSSQILENFEKNFNNNIDQFANTLFSGSASFLDIISRIFGGIVFVIAVFILSFYLTVSRDGVEKFLRAVLPKAHENYTVNMYLRVRQKLGLWLKGQLILSFSVGLITFLGLLILGVDYSLILGIMAGLLEMVPFVGPLLTGTMAFLIAISQSWTLGFYTIALFFGVQQFESHILIPQVMRKTIGLHPVVAVISLLAGSQIAGFVGIILAVPIAVVIQEIIEDWDLRKNSHIHA